MLAPLARLTRNATQLGRQTVLNAVRNHGSHGGVPGENLPFDIHNRYKLTLIAAFYFSSGIALPYLIVRHQLLKNRA